MNNRIDQRTSAQDRQVCRIAQRLNACSTCGVDRGEPCRTAAGQPYEMEWVHFARRSDIETVWRTAFDLGYERGKDAKRIRRAA